uniref:Uncharacterized protein n=1 Tax=Palpitomonas bilix TaxID=652834 RepID=A0A7S3G335_9EUKA|mmetsp:Transcript_21751/g.56469  ORF Transcript_21751/g.56469 Transcript_21751/m.56469 type:complete len:266 (+) Transcript_21751:11-808(+)
MEPSLFSEFAFTTAFCLISPLVPTVGKYVEIVFQLDSTVASMGTLFLWVILFQHLSLGSLADPFLTIGSWLVLGEKKGWTWKRALVICMGQVAGAAFAGHLMFKYAPTVLPAVAPDEFQHTVSENPFNLLSFPEVHAETELVMGILHEGALYSVLLGFMIYASWAGGYVGKALPLVVVPLVYYGGMTGPNLNPASIISYLVFGSETHKDFLHPFTHFFGDLFGATFTIGVLMLLLASPDSKEGGKNRSNKDKKNSGKRAKKAKQE